MGNPFDSLPEVENPKKKAFKAQIPELRNELVAAQLRLRQEKRAALVLFAGVDGAGKHEMVNTLHAWMDPRGVMTRAYTEPNALERERPTFWRYWLDLPANGQIGIFLSAWYSQPLLQRVHRRIDAGAFAQQLQEIALLERTLQEDGLILIKIWMHLDRKAQRKRLESLAADPETEWQVKPGAWENWGLYDRFLEASTQILESSEAAGSPWTLIPGDHRRARTLLAAQEVLRRISADPPPPAKALTAAAWTKAMKPHRGRLAKLDLSPEVPREVYKKKLKKLQRRLYQLQHQAEVRGLSTVLVFEGQDAAGKGGAIRRLVQGLDAREYQVIPIAAPSDEELAHHYLWRFWRHLPRAGRVTIFDRSWYGRVLVERVEGFAFAAEWQRAYAEINAFESQLCAQGTVLLKFWIQIDKDEQLRRFEERQQTPYKTWKITDEDWRNREKWEPYEQAVDDMIALTHTPQAPWILVEGNDKAHARIKVIEQVCTHLEAALTRFRD